MKLQFLQVCVSFLTICYLVSSVFSADEMDSGSETEFPEDEGTPEETYPECTFSKDEEGECKPHALCESAHGKLDNIVECVLDAETKGVCCPIQSGIQFRGRTSKGSKGSPGHLQILPPVYDNVDSAMETRSKSSPAQTKMLKDAQDAVKEKVIDEDENLTRVMEEGDPIEENSPAGGLDRFHRISKHFRPEIEQRINLAEMDLHVTAEMASKLKDKKAGFVGSLSDFSITNLESRSKPGGECHPKVYKCDVRTKRRRYDGSCNNLENPTWGIAGSTYQRLIDSDYEDGFNALRVQHNGDELPSARAVSQMYSEENPTQEQEDPEHTLMLAQFGQFLNHDLTSTPQSSTNGVQCCTRSGRVQARENAHRNCIPIPVSKADPFYKAYGQRCLHMVRSAPAVRTDCKLGPREQFNTATSYIDGSQIYGSDTGTAKALRAGKGGLMRQSSTKIEKKVNNSEGFLSPEDTSCESIPPRCKFDAGDDRVNENMQLAVLHTIFLREHNRLARALGKMNPHWNDESIFHEARRIVIAELQHITYNEFLPIVIGVDYLNYHKMLPHKNGDFTNLYVNTVDATIINSFAAAAFRFGHTLMPWDVSMADKNGHLTDYIHLKRSFFNPAGLYKNLDRFLIGMTKQNCRRFDPYFTSVLTQQLFENDHGWGLDLLALNIQRGRDHGLPDYSKYLRLCGGPNITNNWNALKNNMRPEALNALKSIYPAPQEIDLFAGGIGEIPEGGALVGKTFTCIIGNTFIRLRKGDRLFYEEKSAGFSKAQLNELRKVSLARILCDNSKGVKKIQPLVMRQTKKTNQEVSCGSKGIPKLNLSAWKHKRT